MKSQVFEVVVLESSNVTIPQNIARPFIENGHSRVVVKATYQNHSITFHAAIRKYLGQYMMMFSKAKQKELALLPNDRFQMQFFEDTSTYGVDVPEEFEAVIFSDYEAQQIFESFTKGKQRGIIYMITRFKDSQKKIDKTLILCENLKRGIRENKELLKTI